MKILHWAALLAASLVASQTARADSGTFVTSTEAAFERVENFEHFGVSWQSHDGRIWSSFRGEFTNDPTSSSDGSLTSDAIRECAKAGGMLPEARDFEALASHFEANGDGTYFSARGQKDLYTLFPFMKDRWFWSASFYPSAQHPGRTGYYAFNDHGFNGVEAYFITADERAGVICVAQEP